jgi:hypothetical protein
MDERDAVMLQLQQGVEIRLCIETWEIIWQSEKGGEPGDAHRGFTLYLPCSRGCRC